MSSFFYLLYNESMKRTIQGFIQGLYEAIDGIEVYKGRVKREEVEEFVFDWICSIVNKVSVFLGAVFIYFFFKFRGIEIKNLFQSFLAFWLVWIVTGNHLTKLQKFLQEHKRENK